MNIKEFEKRMNEICPLELQEEWDNCGLQLNSSLDGEIENILVALEISQAVVDEAKSLDVDMIVTHHPMFFGAFKSIVPELLPTRYSLDLIRSGISVYSAHTNFDTMEGGNNDYLAKLLGFTDIICHGILRSGRVKLTGNTEDPGLSQVPTVKDMGNLISEKLGIERSLIRIIGNPESKVENLAWCTGAGASFIMDAIDLGADLYITGDIKYHEATTIKEFGLNALDIGHFGSEKIFTDNMTDILKRELPDLTVIASEMDKDPFDTVATE